MTTASVLIGIRSKRLFGGHHLFEILTILYAYFSHIGSLTVRRSILSCHIILYDQLTLDNTYHYYVKMLSDFNNK